MLLELILDVVRDRAEVASLATPALMSMLLEAPSW